MFTKQQYSKIGKNPCDFSYVFYLICGCPTANFVLLLRGQPHCVLIIDFFSSFDLKVTGNLVTRFVPKGQPSVQWGLKQEPTRFNGSPITH